MYSGVFIDKEANTTGILKELPARDCKIKEAKSKVSVEEPLPVTKVSKELPAWDCKTKDGENSKCNNTSKERSDPLPANNYDKTLETIMRIMVISAISACDNKSEVLHHHVYDPHTESWK